MRIRIVWTQPNSFPELLCRPDKVVSRSERVPQVIVSVKVVRCGLYRRTKIRNRSLTLPGSNQSASQCVIRGCILRTKADRQLVMSDCFVHVAAGLQHRREVIVCLEISVVFFNVVPGQRL